MRYVGLTSFLGDARYPEDLKRTLVERIRIERPELYEKLKQQESVLQELQKRQDQQQQPQQEQQQQGTQQ
jgi:hypothetical protein